MFRVFQQNRAVLAGTAAATAAVTYFIVRPKQHPDRIVIVGGGTAGIGVAAMLQNEGEKDFAFFFCGCLVHTSNFFPISSGCSFMY